LAPRIREFNWRTDRHAVLSFQREVYERNFPGFVSNKAFMRDFARQVRSAVNAWAEKMWVLEDNGRVCGFLWAALISTLVDPCVGYIKNIYVAPHLRRQGWGKALLATAEDWFVANGAPKAALDASACNEEAVGLYHSQGYRITRYRMEKPLQNIAAHRDEDGSRRPI